MTNLGEVTHITVHHSASSRDTTLEMIHQWHRQKGWRSCGYHFVIEARGEVRYGRPLNKMGAHVGGNNERNIGICVVGNNALAGSSWTEAQCLSLRELCAALIRVYNLEPSDILGHGDWDGAQTECPGIDLSAILDTC